MLLPNNKKESFNTIMILILILIFIIYYIANYFKYIENFKQYGVVACPPQFEKVGDTENIYYNSGNIGIGIADPKNKLDVSGNTKVTGTLTVTGTSEHLNRTNFTGGIMIHNDWCRIKGKGGVYFESYGGGWYMSDATWIRQYGGKRVWMDNIVGVGKKLSVGHSNPHYECDVKGNICARGGWLRTVGHHGLYSDSYGCYFYPNDKHYGNWLIHGNGKIGGWAGIRFAHGGIGDSTLMMGSGGGARHGGIHFNGVGWAIHWAKDRQVHTYNTLHTPYLQQHSDRRIKKNINKIDTKYGLDIILKLNPVTYKRLKNNCTVIEEGNENCGFIAQEVKNILPNCVSYNEEYISNIFENAKCKDYNIYINNENIKINEKIRIFYNDELQTENKECVKECIVIDIKNDYIVIDTKLDVEKCFVYGTFVNDKHSLSYNDIFSVNVSATQELHKIIMKQQSQIELLMNKLEKLEMLMTR